MYFKSFNLKIFRSIAANYHPLLAVRVLEFPITFMLLAYIHLTVLWCHWCSCMAGIYQAAVCGVVSLVCIN